MRRGAHDAPAHGETQPQRIAERVDRVAHAHLLRARKRDGVKARNGLALCGRARDADNGKVDVGVVVDHALDRARFARDERRAPADRAVDGVVVRHGKTVRRDEEGAGVGGRFIGLDGLLVREKVKAENGGEVAVGGLAGGQRLAAQTERVERPRRCRAPSRVDRRAACRRPSRDRSARRAPFQRDRRA